MRSSCGERPKLHRSEASGLLNSEPCLLLIPESTQTWNKHGSKVSLLDVGKTWWMKSLRGNRIVVEIRRSISLKRRRAPRGMAVNCWRPARHSARGARSAPHRGHDSPFGRVRRVREERAGIAIDGCRDGAAQDSERDFEHSGDALHEGPGAFEQRSFQLQHVRAQHGQLCRELFEQTFV